MVRRHWLLVVLTIAATVSAAIALTPRDDRYAAEARLFVGSPPVNLGAEVSSDRLVGLSYVAATFVEMIQSYPVAAEAVERSGVDRLPEDVLDNTRALSTGTQLITVQVIDEDPAVAQTLADDLSQAFIDELARQERQQQAATGAFDDGLTPVSLFAPARLPTLPEPSSLPRNTMLGLLFGVLVAAALLLLLEYLDLTVRTADDAERRIGLPVLGVIPATAGSPELRFGPGQVRG